MNEDLKKQINSVDFNYYMKKKLPNGLFLSDEEIDILNRYKIDYKSVTTLNELIYKIDEYLDEDEVPELEWLASSLAEVNYYQNTNK